MSEKRPPARGRVLVVDDNPVILKALFSYLVSHGFEVTIALDGSEVMSCVRQQKPDVILLDIFFPPYVEGGIIWDGFLILDWLHGPAQAADIPVIIISSADPEKYKERCLSAGARAYFKKPLPLDELIETMLVALTESARKAVAEKNSGLPTNVS